MEQRSPEWFEARKGMVTGSVAGSILGLSPWQSREDVLRRMVREYHGAESEMRDSPPLAYGRMNEAGAIFEFEMDTGFSVQPASFVVFDDGDSWLGASPDGYICDDAIIEVKTPYSLRNGGEFKSIAEYPHYSAQIQVQLHCTGRKRCAFYQWAPHDTNLEWIDYDPDWISTNIPRLRQFYAEYLDELDNPDHLAPKRVTIDTPEAARMVREYDELCEAEENVKERKKDLLADMVRLAGEKNADFAGRKLTLTTRQGSVSYAKAVSELAPGADLSKWRGKEIKFWSIK